LRLDFNVLWVDDQPSYIDAQIVAIKARMAQEGFDFNPTQCTSINEVEELISGDVFQDEVDLVMVDWDLGNDVKGQDVIERIREVVRYKDVIFYSSLMPAADLRRLAFEQKLEGVYCASKGELVEEVLGVFEALVKKVLDLDHTRGIVMGATSDIDHLVNTCLTGAHTKLDDEGKATFMEDALRRIADKVKYIAKQGEKIKNNPSLEDLFKAHMLLTADDRLRMLASILKMEAFEAHAGATVTIRSYRDGVVPLRNDLGHMVLAPQGRPQAIETTEGKQVSLDQMRTLRKLILDLREDFRALADALKA